MSIESPQNGAAQTNAQFQCSRRTAIRGLIAQGVTAGLANPFAWAANLFGGGAVLLPAVHHRPRARQLIQVFLTGGVSHIDTFDPKPRLREMHGKPIPAFGLRPDESRPLPLLGSPYEFARGGKSGLWVSDLFPHLRTMADELCVFRTLHTDIVEHFQATLAMHTGSSTVPLPSLGSWLSYGLGGLNPNLPAYVVLAEHLPYAGAQVWDSNFLPPEHQGVRLIPGDDPIPHLRPAKGVGTLRDLEMAMLDDLNREHARLRVGDLQLPARSASFSTALGMMATAPDALDVARESSRVREEYGVGEGDRRSFAWQCLAARRLIERGVRTVEIIDTGSHDNWDSHGDMATHRPKALRVDRALAALLRDLRRTGLLDDTLVMICTEFGRTPWSDGGNGKGRNHYAKVFSSILAGAGIRGGMAYGESDDFGAAIAHQPVHVHDYHATLLHVLGIDHTRLTYRYAGRDFRLTDVAGNVVEAVLA